MRRILTTLTLAAFLFAAPLFSITNNVSLLRKNIYPLQWVTEDKAGVPTMDTHCTAFSVNPKYHGWVTAAHCIVDMEKDDTPRHAGAYFIDGHAANVVEVDVEKDLARLVTPTWGIPTWLKLAKQAPVVGDSLETYGYAWGLKYPFYFTGIVAASEYEDYIYTAMQAIGGMSGGPVVNSRGELVGIVHVGVGGGLFSADSPILGSTTWQTLKQFDRGWVFAR